MNYRTASSMGPGSAPPAVYRLVLFTVIVAIVCAAVQTALDQLGISPGPEHYLSLSWYGLKHGYIWQLITFLFIESSAPFGLSLFFFIQVGISAYVLWILGSSLVDLVGTRPFLRLYFIGGIGSALCALLVTGVFGYNAQIAGNTSALLVLLTAWSMAYSDAQIYLFFLIPIKAKWLIVIVFGVLALIALTHLNFVSFTLYVSAILIGYIFAVVAFGWNSPFPETAPVEAFLRRMARKIPFKGSSSGKIIDIKTVKKMQDDDVFVDAMLEKISKHGESSLSWQERIRLKKISEKRNK